MKLQTVTGETIEMSEWSGYSLNFVVDCGQDWIADVSICDGAKPANNRHARVFVSQNKGVENLMALAHARGELAIKHV
jgi:hypothetical protein